MLLTQEPTFVILMVFNTRTNHRKYMSRYMYFTSWNDTLLETIIMQSQKFLIQVMLHEDRQQDQLGGMLGLVIVTFSSCLSLPFITFQHLI